MKREGNIENKDPSPKIQASNSKIKECILGALNLVIGA